MSDSARVGSLDELRRFRGTLCKLADELRGAIHAADADIARASQWLSDSQTRHWNQQVRIRTEEFGRARSALARKQSERSALDARVSCVEEEKALQKAGRRLEEAKQKVAATKRWTRKLEEAVFGYQPLAHGLMSALEVDVPRGLARLDEMGRALEAYLGGGPEPEWVQSAASEATMRRTRDDDNDAGAAQDAEPAADKPTTPTEPRP